MNLLPLFAILFALFPLTDTDIWWHLACSREWVTTWTPVRGPVVNVHEYFQQVVGAVYALGGAPLLVAFKAVLWGIVFALFLRPSRLRAKNGGQPRWNPVALLFCVFLLFVFRFQMEIRPVLFSLLFLGVYWNVLPALLDKLAVSPGRRPFFRTLALAVVVFLVQWVWCRFQGLYILGPLFALLALCPVLKDQRKKRDAVYPVAFVLLLFAAPFLHEDGLMLFLYPFGLLDRLVGLSDSASVFAKEIAENRSPLTLLLARENVLASALMLALPVVAAVRSIYRLYVYRNALVLNAGVIVTACLALVAERNFVLLLPLLVVLLFESGVIRFLSDLRCSKYVCVFLVASVLGFWCRSVVPYDRGMVAYQRVPVGAAGWMKSHPHAGRLFNDDRAGGYLAFESPADSVYIDGRFILKTADFFERYLRYAADPALFLSDADSLGIDRAVFPLRYYARWGVLLGALEGDVRWKKCYADEYFIVFCKK